MAPSEEEPSHLEEMERLRARLNTWANEVEVERLQLDLELKRKWEQEDNAPPVNLEEIHNADIDWVAARANSAPPELQQEFADSATAAWVRDVAARGQRLRERRIRTQQQREALEQDILFLRDRIIQRRADEARLEAMERALQLKALEDDEKELDMLTEIALGIRREIESRPETEGEITVGPGMDQMD